MYWPALYNSVQDSLWVFSMFFPQGRGWRLFVYGCITVAIICDIITEQDWRWGGGGVESGIATLSVGDRGNASFLFGNLVCRFQHDGYIYRNSNLRVYAKNTFNAAWVYRMGKRSTQASPLQQHLYKFKVMYFFASNVSRNVAKSWCPLLCVGFRPGDIVFFLVTNILHNYICLYGDYFLSKK